MDVNELFLQFAFYALAKKNVPAEREGKEEEGMTTGGREEDEISPSEITKCSLSLSLSLSR